MGFERRRGARGGRDHEALSGRGCRRASTIGHAERRRGGRSAQTLCLRPRQERGWSRAGSARRSSAARFGVERPRREPFAGLMASRRLAARAGRGPGESAGARGESARRDQTTQATSKGWKARGALARRVPGRGPGGEDPARRRARTRGRGSPLRGRGALFRSRLCGGVVDADPFEVLRALALELRRSGGLGGWYKQLCGRPGRLGEKTEKKGSPDCIKKEDEHSEGFR